MSDITENRMGASIAAAQRLQLALNHRWEYSDCEAYEEDVGLVFALLEESRDECWPALEERARSKATTG